jgi:peptide subunit release factor RF-3
MAARWPIVPPGETLTVPTMGVLDAVDRQGRRVLVFESEWALRYTAEKNPRVDLKNTM